MPPKADPSKNKPEDDQDDDAELTPAQVNAINAAVTAQLKRGLKDVVTKTDLETFGASIGEKLAAQLQQQPAPAKGDKPKDEPAISPEMKKLQERLDQLAAANKKATDDAAAEKRGRLLDKAQADAHRMLFVEGIGEKKLKAKAEYADLLGDHFGRKLKVTDDGKVVMTIRQAPAKGLPEEDTDVSLEDGLKSWIKSDAARAYLPAPQPGGRNGNTRSTQQRRSQLGNQPEPRPQTDENDLDAMVGNAAAQLESMGIDPRRLPSQ